MVTIRRGDICWVNLDPTLGSEIKKTRPCLVVSNDISNRFSSLITVVPLTSQKLSRIYPHEVLIATSGNFKSSKIKVNQIRTIDKMRVGKKISSASRTIMNKVNWALANHLDLLD